MKQEQQNISFVDKSILPFTREGDGPNLYDGRTKLVSSAGVDTLVEVAGPFTVVASAAKYLVDIIHADLLGGMPRGRDGPITGEQQRELFFDGGFTIYRTGLIPRTKIRGVFSERSGGIWTARPPVDRYTSPDGLRNLLFDDSSNPTERIEAILADYQTREDNRRATELQQMGDYVAGTPSRHVFSRRT